MPDSVPILPGLATLAGRYDALILDLWGVLHDGVAAYPGAIDCLAHLQRAGRRVLLLSNAPRRVYSVIERLEELGIRSDLYNVVMTSGEATHQALRNPPDDFHAALGRFCLHVGPPRDANIYEGLDLEVVDDPAAASFVLNTGIDDWDETVEDYHAVLAACAVRGLPMVCANPDLVVVIGDRLAICAGTLAQHYEGLGGRVAYHGKPHPPIYRRCFALLGDPDPARVLAVGDNLDTDIAGANAAGIDSVLVTGGIHAEMFHTGNPGSGTPGSNTETPPDPQRLAAAVRKHGQAPKAAIRRFAW